MLDLRHGILFHLCNFPNLQGGGVNKSELIDHVANAASINKRSATAAVDAMLDNIVATVKAGQKVSLLGFGTFAPSARAARTGRNPQTGAPVNIAASKSVRFTPGTPFKAVLNNRAVAKKAPAKKAAAKKATKKAPATKAAKAARKR
jgi:nucleoid DNA-binding protein